ncbi:MAG: 3-hydroxyacyl-CoA dehydrogenase family protein [bacterium]
MISTIKKAVVLGSGGTMGSLTGGIIAQSGIKTCFMSRLKEHAERGLERAIHQSRSETIGRNSICGEYKGSLRDALQDADWVVECVTENVAIKQSVYKEIEPYLKPDAVVSTTTSSLPLSRLCDGMSETFKRNFLGVHFYNPPAKILACEVAAQRHTDPEVTRFMSDFLEHNLGRVVIPVQDTSAFAGNRIAFLLFCEITALAEEYGVELIDYLLGPYTGRIMSPLATIDLVGLDIHKAIIENLYRHTNDHMHHAFRLPRYIEKMIENGCLGSKTPDKGGFYKRDGSRNKLALNPATLDYEPVKRPKVSFVEEAKEMIRAGHYNDAFAVIMESPCGEADLVRRILCTYISYSYSCIGEVTEAKYGIDGIDTVMASGYNWAPPSLVLNMMGGAEKVTGFLRHYDCMVPDALEGADKPIEVHGDPGGYFWAR